MQRGVSALETLGDAYSSDGDYRAALKSYQRAFDLCAGEKGSKKKYLNNKTYKMVEK